MTGDLVGEVVSKSSSFSYSERDFVKENILKIQLNYFSAREYLKEPKLT